MSHEDETVFLRKRHGFVKMAIRHGSALVPAFAFGQGNAFSWYRPGPPLVPQSIVEWMSRKAGELLQGGPYSTTGGGVVAPLPCRSNQRSGGDAGCKQVVRRVVCQGGGRGGGAGAMPIAMLGAWIMGWCIIGPFLDDTAFEAGASLWLVVTHSHRRCRPHNHAWSVDDVHPAPAAHRDRPGAPDPGPPRDRPAA